MSRISNGARKRAERRIREQSAIDPTYSLLPGGQTLDAMARRQQLATDYQDEVIAANACYKGNDGVVMVVDPGDRKGTEILRAVNPEVYAESQERQAIAFFGLSRNLVADTLKTVNPRIAATLEDGLPGIPFVVMAEGGSLLCSVE
jgi:hypothetical protein